MDLNCEYKIIECHPIKKEEAISLIDEFLEEHEELDDVVRIQLEDIKTGISEYKHYK